MLENQQSLIKLYTWNLVKMMLENPVIIVKSKSYTYTILICLSILCIAFFALIIHGSTSSIDNIFYALIPIICLCPIPVIGLYFLYKWSRTFKNRIVFFDNDLLIEDHKLIIPWYDINNITICFTYVHKFNQRHMYLLVKTKADEKYSNKKISKKSKYSEYGLMVADLLGYNCNLVEVIEFFINRLPNIHITIVQSSFNASLELKERESLDELSRTTKASIKYNPY